MTTGTTDKTTIDATQEHAVSGILAKVLTYWGGASKAILKDKKVRDNIYKVLEDSELITALLGPKIAGAADGFKIFLGTDTDAILRDGIRGETGTKLLNDGITASTKQLGYYVASNYLGLKDPEMASRVGGFIGTMVGGQASTIIFKKLGIPATAKAQETEEVDNPSAEEIAKKAVEDYKAKEVAAAKATEQEKTIAQLKADVERLKGEVKNPAVEQPIASSEEVGEKVEESSAGDVSEESSDKELSDALEGTGAVLETKERGKKERESDMVEQKAARQETKEITYKNKKMDIPAELLDLKTTDVISPSPREEVSQLEKLGFREVKNPQINKDQNGLGA